MPETLFFLALQMLVQFQVSLYFYWTFISILGGIFIEICFTQYHYFSFLMFGKSLIK